MSSEDLSSSDSDYNDNEKILLNKFKNRYKNDSESENESVLGVGSGEDDSDDDGSENHMSLSDIEGQDSDDLPDIRAWGKDKRKFYGTDYIDADYGGYQEKDIQAAEIEEEEAKNLQRHLAEQLDDNDFDLDIIFQKKDQPQIKDSLEEVVKTDLSKLTDKEKLSILQKDSPEFFALIDDFKAKTLVASDCLSPIIKRLESGQIEVSEATRFVKMYYALILNYCANIYMYLLLKSTKESNNHPVIKRLFQYRQLLSKLEPVFQEVIQPQLDLLSSDSTNIDIEKKTKKRKKLLNILAEKESALKKTKKVTFVSNKEIRKIDNDQSQSSAEEIDEIEENKKMLQQEIEKRPITYQIAKNKGLTPRRKKEYRNPRVKHKLKYRKALIRRKGAVREPRHELKKYSGEISGIKATVSKSIKIKC